MKQKDIVLIIVVGFFSAVISIFASKALISSSKNRNEKVTIVQPITSNFPTPDNKYFNNKAIDPTVLIRVGDNTKQPAFNGSQ
jgi:hypothetical protein